MCVRADSGHKTIFFRTERASKDSAHSGREQKLERTASD
jgi:hypothetical protein